MSKKDFHQTLQTIDENDPQSALRSIKDALKEGTFKQDEQKLLNLLHDFFFAQCIGMFEERIEEALALMHTVLERFKKEASEQMQQTATFFITYFEALKSLNAGDIVRSKDLFLNVQQIAKELDGYKLGQAMAINIQNDILALEGANLCRLGKWSEAKLKYEEAKLNCESKAIQFEKSNPKLFSAFWGLGGFYISLYNYEKLIDDLTKFDFHDKLDNTALKEMDSSIKYLGKSDLDDYGFRKCLYITKAYLTVCEIVVDIKRKLHAVQAHNLSEEEVFIPVSVIKDRMEASKEILKSYNEHRAIAVLDKIFTMVININRFIINLSGRSFDDIVTYYNKLKGKRAEALKQLLVNEELERFFHEALYYYSDQESIAFLIHQKGRYQRILDHPAAGKEEELSVEKNRLIIGLIGFLKHAERQSDS